METVQPRIEEALQIRPCLRERIALTRARWDFIARYSGRRSPEWIGRQLGMTTMQVAYFMQRWELGPTTRTDLLTSGYVADMLGCTQHWVVRLIKAGKLHGWKNPGGWRGRAPAKRWWLIPRAEVERYLRERGQRVDDVRLTAPDGWPRVIVRRGGRHAHRVSGAHALR